MQRSQNYFFILTLKVVSSRQLFVKSTSYYSSRLVASRGEENPWKHGSSFFIFLVKFFREHFPLNRETYRILFRLLLRKYFLFISYDLSLVILFVLFTPAKKNIGCNFPIERVDNPKEKFLYGGTNARTNKCKNK